MFIQCSPLSTSTSCTALPFASDHGKEGSMDLFYNWSHCDKTWQMSPKFEDRPLNGCTQSISIDEEQNKYSALSIINCTSSSQKKIRNVYKRRKFHTRSSAPSSKENATAIPEGIFCIRSEELTLSLEKDHLSILPIISLSDFPKVPQDDETNRSSQIRLVPYSTSGNISVREDEVPEEAIIGECRISTSDSHLIPNGRCSPSESNKEYGSNSLRSEVGARDCSSFADVVEEPSGDFTVVRELCISVLKSHGLLGGVCTTTECSYEVLCDIDTNLPQSCNVCGILENPLKMLICDLCEEAFHLSCCNHGSKELKFDEWYCQPCFRKKSKALRKTEKSFGEMDEHRKRISQRGLGLISFMLLDSQTYTSQVRIGKDFQVEVPDWSGPSYDNHECSGEPLEMDPAEFSFEDVWASKIPSKPKSIGNWVQCQEVIDGTICGKWRRAPLSVVQTDNWDCSCAVLWDPCRADCAVPQELETKTVLEHLKCREELKHRLVDTRPN